MNRQPHSSTREIIVAEAIKEVVSELRLVDVGDYIAYIRLERFASVADLVDSAAELFFVPGTLKLGHGGEAHSSWENPPRIVLDLELRPVGVTVYFALTMTAKHASVEVNYVAFEDASPDPLENNAFLERALEEARIRKTEPAVAHK
ncbi:hypothetical protein FY036_19750 [Mesorhizobium microcysteis]|jgi:hypothetical protein|uniref:Uncharacterized protein n=1 Tax=Neoaquamicrobium microcysteis TaxID=2682781 RepID=A0A5D4GPY8_9HYPH|nr:hypothetical protein [Mesorhizobium microcysteis]TYR30122.1 hypothetical protein FY036_19750 [Mesorhizobium microcysteis]